MELRKLELKDAPGMFEWMRDPERAQHFSFIPEFVTMDSVEEFINKAAQFDSDRHYAIVDENDEYLGTISLKDINDKHKRAEYAIALRESASGKGIGYKATMAILDIAFNELGLNRVYLNVFPENKRAIALYLKCGFKFEGEFRQHVFIRGEFRNLKWYGILRDEYEG